MTVNNKQAEIIAVTKKKKAENFMNTDEYVRRKKAELSAKVDEYVRKLLREGTTPKEIAHDLIHEPWTGIHTLEKATKVIGRVRVEELERKEEDEQNNSGQN